MTKQIHGVLAIVAAAGMMATGAQAQDAAETATILSTTSQQRDAGRSLGDAISGALNSAGNTIRQSRSTARGSSAPVRTGVPVQVSGLVDAAPVERDALEHTDAAAYRLDNGAGVRVSGRFHPSTATRCEENCPEE